jgi:hypothetical protein
LVTSTASKADALGVQVLLPAQPHPVEVNTTGVRIAPVGLQPIIDAGKAIG